MTTAHTPTPQRVGPLSYEAGLAAQLRNERREAIHIAALENIAQQSAPEDSLAHAIILVARAALAAAKGAHS